MKRLVIILLMLSSTVYGDDTEERFQHLFRTAGYATVFGAALGAAALSFQADPGDHLKFIAVGASVGFIGGSVMGAYIAFSPMFMSDTQENDSGVGLLNRPTEPSGLTVPAITIVPTFESSSLRLRGVQGQLALAAF